MTPTVNPIAKRLAAARAVLVIALLVLAAGASYGSVVWYQLWLDTDPRALAMLSSVVGSEPRASSRVPWPAEQTAGNPSGAVLVEWKPNPRLRNLADPELNPVTEFAPPPIEVPPATAKVAPAPQSGDIDTPTFDGRPIRVVKTIRMLTTGYSPDSRSCGDSADGITASGYSVWTNGMKMVAADKRVLPFGALVAVPGYNKGKAVPVLDRGGKIKGNHLDLLFPTHEQARAWGRRYVNVEIWDYAD